MSVAVLVTPPTDVAIAGTAWIGSGTLRLTGLRGVRVVG